MREGVFFRVEGGVKDVDDSDLTGESLAYRAFSLDNGAGEDGERSARVLDVKGRSSCSVLREMALIIEAGVPREDEAAASGRRPRFELGMTPEGRPLAGREKPFEKCLEDCGAAGAGDEDAGTRTAASGEELTDERKGSGDAGMPAFLFRSARRASCKEIQMRWWRGTRDSPYDAAPLRLTTYPAL
jgi:hypothetical protein